MAKDSRGHLELCPSEIMQMISDYTDIIYSVYIRINSKEDLAVGLYETERTLLSSS